MMQNLRGASPLNTVSVTLTRGQASLYLWQVMCWLSLMRKHTALYSVVNQRLTSVCHTLQHACSSAAKTEEIISCGGIQQAMNGLRVRSRLPLNCLS
jgi:hypothetical protein